jgi:enoyl-[acyl-carrier protein] reductase I
LDQAVILGGKIDFVLHSIGMSVNVRKGNHYTNQNYEYTEKGWNVSAVSFHKVMQVCIKDAMNEWGYCCLIVYGSGVFSDYNDMADNKAYLESVARSFGYFLEEIVRVNTPNHQRLQRLVKLLKALMVLAFADKNGTVR